MYKKKVLIILASSRSGTSALGGSLNILGISMGKILLSSAYDNPKGFYENKDITEFNNSILLSAISSSWDDLTPIHARVINYFLKRKDLLEKAINIVELHYSSDIIFGIKDPRMAILFPFWEKVFKKLDLDINVILPYRNPIEVALSLQNRNNFSTEKGLLLWAKYSLYAEFYSRDYKRVFVSYDDLLNKTDYIIDKIIHCFNLKFPKDYRYMKPQIADFLDTKLKHHNKNNLGAYDYKYEFVKGIKKLFKGLSTDKISDNRFVREKFEILRKEYYNTFESNPNVERLGVNPFAHWIRWGKNRVQIEIKKSLLNKKK